MLLYERAVAGIMAALGLRASFQVRDYLTGMRNYSAMKVFNIIHEIRMADAHSKGLDVVASDDGEILKELLYKILHG